MINHRGNSQRADLRLLAIPDRKGGLGLYTSLTHEPSLTVGLVPRWHAPILLANSGDRTLDIRLRQQEALVY